MTSYKMCIDYVSATFPDTLNMPQLVYLGVGDQLPNARAPLQKGYSRGMLFTTGVFINWNERRPEMGYHVVASGSALRNLLESGVTGLDYLTRVHELKGRTSRVDYAIDVFDGEMTMDDLSKHKRLPYKGKGRTPRVLPVGTNEDGWTVYVGARTSDKMLRIYDKAKEQGDFETKHNRIELETKGDVAHWLGHELAYKSAEEGYALACELIRTVAEYPHPDFQGALSRERVEWSIPQKTDADTLKWLKTSVASAMVRMMVEKPHIDVWNELGEAVKEKMAARGL